MKLLLIEPPRINKYGNLRILGSLGSYKADMCWEPLDLTIISGFLDKNNFESDIFDANATKTDFKGLKKVIRNKNPDAVVFTTSTSTIYSDLKVAEVTKKINRDIKTIAIGTHAAAVPKETMSLNKNLDIIIRDTEPELAVLNLVKKNLIPKKVLGTCYRDRGRVKLNKLNAKIRNLDDLGVPSHQKLDLKLYNDPFQRRKPMMLTYGSRGCWHGKCIYCSCPFFFQPQRVRSVNMVIKELEWAASELGVREVKWFDAEFNNFPKWVDKLLDEIIKRKIDISWSALARVDNLKPNIIRKMRRAGCHTMHVGVESGDEGILRRVGKNITIEQVKKTVRNIKDQHVNVVTYFMLGLPGETKDTMSKTLKLAKTLDSDATTFSIATPHPGTAFYNWVEKNKFFITKDYSKFDPSLPPVFNSDKLSSKDVYEFMKHAYLDFYFRPSYIIKKISKIRRPVELKNGIKNSVMLLKRYA